MRIITNFLLVTLLLSAVSSINATYFNIQIFSSQNGGCLGLISDEYHDYNDCFPFTVGATTYYAQLDSGACNAGGLGAGTLMVYAAGDTSCGGSFLNDGNAPFTDGSYTVGSCANTFKAGDMGDYLITCDFATTPTTTTTTTTTTGPTTTTTTGSNIFAMTVFNDNGAAGPYTCASTVLDTVSVYADQCFLLPQQAVPVGVIGAGTYYGKFPSTCDNSGAANNIQVYTDAACTNAQSGVSFSAKEGVCDTYFDSKTYIGSCIAGGTTAPAATTTTTAVQPYLIVEYFTGTTCGTADTPATATVMKDTCFAIGDALSTYLGQSGLYGWVYFSGSVYSPPDSSYLFPTNQGDDWKVELYTDSGCNSQYSTTNAVVMGATSGACVIPDGGAATASVKATWVDPSVSTTTTTTIDTTTTTTTTTGVSSTSVSFALFSDTACSVVGSPAQGFGTVGSTCFNNPNAGVSDVIVTSCTAGTNGVVIDQYSTEDGTCVTFAQTATLTEGECTNLGSGSLIAYCALTTGALPTTTTTTAGPTTTTTTTTAGPTTTTTTTTAGPTTTTTTTTAGPTTTTTTTTAGPTTTTTTTTAGPTTTTTTTTAGPTTTTTTTTAGPTTTTTTGPTTTAAPTTTLSPNGDSVASNSSSSLTTGEKVGIGVGSAAGFTLISVLVYLGWAAKAAKAAKVAADAADAAEMVSPKPETKQFDQHQHQHQVTVQISHSASPV